MQALNSRRLVAIHFLTLDFMVGAFIPWISFFLNPLLYRLDKRIFWLGSLYYSGEMAYSYLKPQNFWSIVNLYQIIAHQVMPPDQLALLPDWALGWILPLVMFGIGVPLVFLFTNWLEAKLIDRFYLWKKLKNLFLSWGMIH